MDYELIKIILKKHQIKNKKKQKNQCQIAACEHKKPLARNENLIKTKKTRPRMAVNGLGKPFRKQIRFEKLKKVKIRVKLQNANKKLLPRNRIFVQTPFSHSTRKIERKNSRRKTTRLFALFPVSA